MPIDMNYVQHVIMAYGAQPASLGHFPNGTTKTITAAEVLKNHMPAANYVGAISIAEMQVGLNTVFVVGNSGAANALANPASAADFDAANVELRQYFGPGHRFAYANHGQYFYAPLHDATIQHVQGCISPAFDGIANLVSKAEADNVIATVRNTFLRSISALVGTPPPAFAGIHGGQQNFWNAKAIVRNRYTATPGTGAQLYDQLSVIRGLGQGVLPTNIAAQNAVRDLMALALALRLGLCAPLATAAIKADFTTLLADLRQRGRSMDSSGAIETIALHAKHLAYVQHSVDPNSQPANQCTGTGAVFNGLFTQVWTMLDQSRFCAEPKTFGYIRTNNHDGLGGGLGNARLLGQTCFWWAPGGGPGNPVAYQVIGPQGNEANAALPGSYMWPCPSCRNRSGQMVAGLTQGPLRSGRIGMSHEI